MSSVSENHRGSRSGSAPPGYIASSAQSPERAEIRPGMAARCRSGQGISEINLKDVSRATGGAALPDR